MSRLDALVGRKNEKSGKTHWTKIGVAFPRDRGGYSLKLDALPLDGEILLAIPLERGDRPAQGREPGDDSGEQPNW
jgi:hypothetical protein